MPPPVAPPLSLPAPPGPRGPLAGLGLLGARGDRLGFFERARRTYGDVVGLRVGPQRIALVTHPELIREVLVTGHRQMERGRGLRRAKRLLGEGLLTSEDPLHLRQRRLMQPAFHRERVAGYARTMVDHAARAADRWTDGATVDAHAEMMRLTLAIAGQTLFDADVEGDAREVGAALEEALAVFEVSLLPLSEVLDHLPVGPMRRFRRARATLDRVIYRIIAERHASGDVDRGDLLSMLLAARDEEDAGARMSDEQIRDEVLTLLLAGHETTANALTFAWQLLARHPEAERRLHEEVDAVLGRRPPTADDAARLPWTRAVIAEAMRLYPPAWVLGYRARTELALGGFRIARGTLILMSQYLVQRDARWFEAPEAFRPERWLAASPPERPRFAYFPFGGGARQCIGEGFAWMEAVLVLATLASRWRLTTTDAGPIGTVAGFTLRPVGAGMVARRRPASSE